MVMQIKHLVLHSDQSYTDMRLTPLEIVLSSRDTVRRARESHLIETAMILKKTLWPRPGGLPYKRNGDARRLALGMVSHRMFVMESHCIFAHSSIASTVHKEISKTCSTLTTQKSPLVSLSLSHTHCFVDQKGFVS